MTAALAGAQLVTRAGTARCAACGGPLAFFGPREGYRYFRCGGCGSIQLVPMPEGRALAGAYEDHYATSGHSKALEDPERWKTAGAPYHDAVVEALARRVRGGNVLDYGSGWGFLCEKLAKKGFSAVGVEPSKAMATRARTNGLAVVPSLEAVAGKKFAAVTLCGVLEHLTDHDRRLRALADALEEGGFLVTLHPTAEFFGRAADAARIGDRRKELPRLHTAFCPPWHTALFSVKGTRALFGRNGFRLVETLRAPQGRSGGWKSPVQACLDAVNRIGWSLAGARWPLVTSHVFVFQKTGAHS